MCVGGLEPLVLEEAATAASCLPQERDVVTATPARDLPWAVACHLPGATLVGMASSASVWNPQEGLQDRSQVRLATKVPGALFQQERLEKGRGRPQLRLHYLQDQPSRRYLQPWR